jgi:hypothetical protein
MSQVRFSKVLQTSTTTKMPTDAQTDWVEGFNAPAGTFEYLLLRGDCTFDNAGGGVATDPVAGGSISTLLQNIRIIINGEVLHDYRAGYEGTTAGLYGYFINSIGGKADEVASGTSTREWYWAIPLGRTYKNTDVVRIETVVTWAASAGTIVSGTLEWWVKYNDNTQTTTTVCPSTSFSHANAIQQVIVKVPQNAPPGSVVSGLLVQNQTANDQLGTQGIRINALSDYGFETEMIRFLNGDMQNGIMFADAVGNPAAQTFLSQIPGCEMISTFGLAGGDLSVQVDSTAVTVRTYTPILTSPVTGTREAQEVRQTQPQVVNTAKAILSQGTQ